MLGSLHFHRNDYTGNIELNIVKSGFYSIKFTITFAGNVNLEIGTDQIDDYKIEVPLYSDYFRFVFIPHMANKRCQTIEMGLEHLDQII